MHSHHTLYVYHYTNTLTVNSLLSLDLWQAPDPNKPTQIIPGKFQEGQATMVWLSKDKMKATQTPLVCFRRPHDAGLIVCIISHLNFDEKSCLKAANTLGMRDVGNLRVLVEKEARKFLTQFPGASSYIMVRSDIHRKKMNLSGGALFLNRI